MLFQLHGPTASRKRSSQVQSRSIVVRFLAAHSVFAVVFALPLVAIALLSGKVFSSVSAQEVVETNPVVQTAEAVQSFLTFRVPTTVKALFTAAVLNVEGDSVFGNDVAVQGNASVQNLVVNGRLTLRNNVTGNNIDINIGEGKVTASNLVYTVTTGSGLSVSGTQNLELSNTDKGSDQKIFKKIQVGEESFEAGSNTDKLTVAAGSGITVSLDKDNKKLTIAAIPDEDEEEGPGALGFTDDGTVVRLITETDSVGIGTDSPSSKLHVVGNTTLEGVLSVSGTTSLRGIENNGDGIANAGSITGATGLTSSGTVTFSGLSTGIVKSSLAGVLSSSAVDLASTDVTGVLGVSKGGTGLSSLVAGDLLFASATNTLSALGIGADDQILTVVNGVPTWTALAGAGELCPTCIVSDPGSTQTITPGSSTATGLVIRQASGGTVDIFAVTNNASATKYFKVDSSGNTTTGGTLTVNPSGTDSLVFSPVAQGSAAYAGTITSEDLTAARTWTLPDSSGTFCLTTGNCNGVGGNFGGTGTTNYISKFTSASVVGDSLLYDNGSAIAIGTTSPTHTLHVVGNQFLSGNSVIGGSLDASGSAKLASTLQVTGAGSFLSTLNVTGATTLSSTLGVTGNTTLGGTLGVTGNATFDTDTLYVDATNNRVGVGTSSPTAGLHITTNSGTALYSSGASAHNAIMGKLSIGSTSPTMTRGADANLNVAGVIGMSGNNFYSTSTGLLIFSNYHNGALTSLQSAGINIGLSANNGALGYGVIETSPTYGMYFNVNASTKLRIDGAGRVGVGTTIPTALLHVSGGASDNAAAIINQTLGGDIFAASSSGTTRMVLSNAGKIGLGTTNPTATLQFGVNTNGAVPTNTDIALLSGKTIRFLGTDGNGDYGSYLSTAYSSGSILTLGTRHGGTDTDGLSIKLGNVGIGTTSPSGKFNVHASSGDTTALISGSSGSAQALYLNTSGTSGYGIVRPAGAATLQLQSAGRFTWVQNGTEFMRMESTGLLGLGTSSPAAPLHVSMGYGNNSAMILNQTMSGDIFTASASGTTRMTLTNTGLLGVGTNAPTAYVHASNGSVNSELVSTSGGTYGLRTNGVIGTSNGNIYGLNTPLVFSTGSPLTERLRIATTGYVGIGTAAPAASLHVSSSYGNNSAAIINQVNSGDIFTASASGTTRLTLTNAGNLALGSSAPTTGYKLDVQGSTRLAGSTVVQGGSGASYLAVNHGAEYRLQAQSSVFTINLGDPSNPGFAWSGVSGNIGIGTATPLAAFHVAKGTGGGAAVIFDQTLSGDILTASASGTTRMTLTNAGRLGIGTNAPAGVLHVNGNTVISDITGMTQELLTVGYGNVRVATGSKFLFETVGTGNSLYRDSGSAASVLTGSSIRFGTDSLASEFGRFDSSGNFGVGQTSPTARLDVKGSSTSFDDSAFRVSNSTTQIMRISNDGRFMIGSGNLNVPFQVKLTSGLPSGAAYTGAFSDSNGDLLLNSQGMVATGTTFAFGANNNGNAIELVSPSGNGVLRMNGANTTIGQMNLSGSPDKTLKVINGTATTGVTSMFVQEGAGQSTSEVFGVYANDGTTSRLVVKDGKVGIGVASPTEKLDMVGNVLITNTGATGSTHILKISGANTNLLTVDGLGNMILNGGTGATNGGNILAYAKINSDTVTDIYTATLDRGSANGGTGLGLGYLFNMENGGGSRTSAGRFTYTWANSTAGSEDSTFGLFTKVGGTLTEGLRIHSGSVALGGTASPSARLEITSRYSNSDLQRWTAADGSRLGRLTETSGGHGWFEVDDSSGNAVALFRADGGNSYISSGNFNIGGTAAGTTANRVLTIANSTAPTVAINNGVQLFAVDQGGSHELQVMDEAGNTTTLSPHNFSLTERSESLAWSFYSQRNGLAINADMTKALRLVEKISGEKLVFIKDLEDSEWVENEETEIAPAQLAQLGEISGVAKWSYELWSFLGEVVFSGPAKFLASVEFRGKTVFAGRVTTEDKDAGGFIVIAAGQSEVEVKFEEAFDEKPVVQVTPEEFEGSYKLHNVSKEGFTLKISTQASEDTTFHWTAIAVKAAKTTRSDASPTPVVVPSTQPQVSPTPEATSSGTLVSPSPSPAPESAPLPSSAPESSGSATPVEQI